MVVPHRDTAAHQSKLDRSVLIASFYELVGELGAQSLDGLADRSVHFCVDLRVIGFIPSHRSNAVHLRS